MRATALKSYDSAESLRIYDIKIDDNGHLVGPANGSDAGAELARLATEYQHNHPNVSYQDAVNAVRRSHPELARQYHEAAARGSAATEFRAVPTNLPVSTGSDNPSPAIDEKVTALRAMNPDMNYEQAVKAVLSANPDLALRYANFVTGRLPGGQSRRG